MRRVWLVTILLAGVVGCSDSASQYEVDPFSVDAEDFYGTFDYMADSALLADMTLSDYHFIPHRPILTPLGEQRLRRLATLLETYGGEIRFNTELTDPVLVTDRITAALDFLADQGVDTTADVLSEGIPAGEGMDAAQAILIKKEAGTFKPDGGEGGMFGGAKGTP